MTTPPSINRGVWHSFHVKSPHALSTIPDLCSPARSLAWAERVRYKSPGVLSTFAASQSCVAGPAFSPPFLLALPPPPLSLLLLSPSTQGDHVQL